MVFDFAFVSRIMEIYKFVVMRYKVDVEFWFWFLDFCRQRKNGRMKKRIILKENGNVGGVKRKEENSKFVSLGSPDFDTLD